MIRSTGSFVYGFPQINRDGRAVIVWQDAKNKWFGEQVVPETVGQFIGLTDNADDHIYEGDIVTDTANGKNDRDWKAVIEFGDTGFGLSVEHPAERDLWELYERGRLKVIGNIHQNKDLLNETN